MTPAQRDLARHALGLPNVSRKSYRNRFVAPAESEDGKAWTDLVVQGLARRRDGTELSGGMDMFWLTREGAEAALLPREKLCSEDFPQVAP